MNTTYYNKSTFKNPFTLLSFSAFTFKVQTGLSVGPNWP